MANAIPWWNFQVLNREATGLPMWTENNLEGVDFIGEFPANNMQSLIG